MLKNWRIKNFKSFGNQPDLSLAAINVLAGANSSGKSSIIQSILLLKQTLQYGSNNRSIALNGPLLRLGAFEDVLNYQSQNETIELGFEIQLNDEDFERHTQSSWMRTFSRYGLGNDAIASRSISLNLKWQKQKQSELGFFSGLPAGPQRNPVLISTDLEMIQNRGKEDQKFYTHFKFTDTEEVENDNSEPRSFSVELDSLTKQEIFNKRPQSSIIGGFLSYFLPSWIFIKFNGSARRAERLAEVLCGSSFTLLTEHAISDEQLSLSVVETINKWLNEKGKDIIPYNGMSIPATVARDAIRAAQPAPYYLHFGNAQDSSQTEAKASLAKLKTEIIAQILKDHTEPKYESEADIPRINDEIGDFIIDFFKEGVRYLGPLRDSPRPVYQPEALESTTDVGYRGEHTAAVLDLNGAQLISVVMPPIVEGPDPWTDTATTTRKVLRDAVVAWLVYLGVATDVVTTDAGVFGHRMQVASDVQGKLHDLTNVGVGVSQVLPIVVMALLAPRGSLLIFEQPELHLHPKVQARLADFFITLAQNGRQLLLETHSEYLIDRLRLRIAQSNTDKVRPLINLLFSEKINGLSQLKPIQVNEFGAISNWPNDFFDQSQADVSAIIRAASHKRRQRKPN
jgi:predicted ATPase